MGEVLDDAAMAALDGGAGSAPPAIHAADIEISAANAVNEGLTLASDELRDKLAASEAENDRLATLLATVTAERDALQAAADKLATAPKVSRSSSGGEARKVGPVATAVGKALTADALLEAIKAAELVEVVFSDGKFELVQIDALTVTGTAWAKVIGGVALRVPELLLHGPAVGQNSWPLAGYGLLLDGKQVAWAPRPEVLQIGGGMQFNLRDDVVFPAE